MPDSDDSATRTLEAARELGPKIRAAADEIEQGRRLPLHLVRDMQRAGVFRMAMPRAWGGPELDFLTQLRVIEELSIADASAGWCTMIGVDGLGSWTLISARAFRSPDLYAGVFLLGIIGYLGASILTMVSSRLLAWKARSH